MAISESKREQIKGMGAADLEERRDSILEEISVSVGEYEAVVDELRIRRRMTTKQGGK